ADRVGHAQPPRAGKRCRNGAPKIQQPHVGRRNWNGTSGGWRSRYCEAAMSTLTMTRATLVKDLRMEWRSKDAINSMLFFALLVVVIFSFAFNPNAEESRHIAGGLIWVAFLFAAVVALNQTWAR